MSFEGDFTTALRRLVNCLMELKKSRRCVNIWEAYNKGCNIHESMSYETVTQTSPMSQERALRCSYL